MINTIYE